MNCALCLAYQREKNYCPGCREVNKDRFKHRRTCIIKNCEYFKKSKEKFCNDKCKKYPCRRLKNLDKRYRTKYHMSMLENLEDIKKLGIRQFVKNEKKRWKCEQCGNLICVHRGCLRCGRKIR